MSVSFASLNFELWQCQFADHDQPNLSFLLLQEEEREKRDNYVPDVSELEKPIEIDAETKDLLKMLDMSNLAAPGVATSGKFGR